MLPGSLRFVAYFNPMTYATAFFRMIVLEKTNLPISDLIKEGLVIEINGFAITPFMTFAIILVIGLVFLLLSTISFVKTDFSRLNRSATDANALWG
jgi:ABC-2 type transport system permease protein